MAPDLFETLAPSFYVSSQAGADVSNLRWLDHVLKKSGHFTGYAPIGGTMVTSLWAWAPRVQSLGSTAACSGAAAAGAAARLPVTTSDEFRQSFSPHRTLAVTDVLLDTCGTFAGILIADQIRQRWQRR